MPRALTEKERLQLKQRLMEEGANCLMQYGVRKTTVDELVKRAQLPKGTFYLLYESKELLLFDVITKLHREIHTDLLSHIEAMEEVTAQTLTDLIYHLFETLEGTYLYRLTTGGELEYLMRKLPDSVVNVHQMEDDVSVAKLLSLFPHLPQDRVETLSAALRAIFLTMLHKREIGEDVFKGALYLMIQGVVTLMLSGGRHDQR